MTSTLPIVLAALCTAAGMALWIRPRAVWRRTLRRSRPEPESSIGSRAAVPAEGVSLPMTAASPARRLPLRRRPAPDVTTLLSALGAELDAGQALEVALDEASRGLDPVPCPRALAAARIGGDVADALRADAEAWSSPGLRALAACWLVAGRSGSGLSASVHRLARAQRASARARGELMAEMATVRASARLLAGLPLVGLLFGMALGAEPLTWLGSTWVGRLALVGGVVLQAAGLLWMHRITARAEAGIP